MKYFLLLAVLLISGFSSAQTKISTAEVYPQFSECEAVDFDSKPECFRNKLREAITKEFNLPEEVQKENFRGEVVVIFEVTQEGRFEVIYINAPYESLKNEIRRIFKQLPQVQPATYNSRPANMQFKMPLSIPLRNGFEISETKRAEPEVDFPSVKSGVEEDSMVDEYDRVKSGKFTNPRHTSQLNIPLSHERYSRFDAEINKVGNNAHSASKPLLYETVNPYYDFEKERVEMLKDADSWLGRKLWNEHLVRFQADDYWFTIDAGFDMQIGKDFEDTEYEFTYNNTRAAIFEGGLGKNLNFYTVVYENQGRFADYYNRYAESIKPYGDPAIVPGRGIAKPFMDGGYDYPVAEGYISFSPGKFFNIQLGHGKNFIGDGYRSLLLSDNATAYPYLKLNTSFWKLKYTNTWMSLRDVRPEVTDLGSYRTKYMANHYLSVNITKRLNIGLFESVLWQNDNDRGFDVNYLNPVIFYRAIEFSTGARGGNAILGLTAKYKWSDKFNTYGQWVIDEFSSGDVFGGENSWKNKLGFQLGVKYYDAFKVPNLYLQAEYNQVRPYTYSHNTVVLNYGHNNQSMAHPWGANFREVIGIARYKKDRYYGSAKFVYGQRGFDYNNGLDNAFYGGDIYRDERDRAYESGVKIGQGNTTNSFFSQLEAGYIVNPATNLKLYASVIYRNFSPKVKTPDRFENSTTWINFGLKTDIFNWYFDY
ncbi:gliding motility protein RemB [Salegentibacter chungangensis]|uniref:Gliding motility protein RemB n=1 Tax=Salegentibacter chungangensis TaxID=1335724 RepID=A0ABW3NPH3_9FLAO